MKKNNEYNRDESIQKLSLYKVDDELKAKGYEYDDARVFIPYKYKNPENPDCRDIYLAISRHATEETKLTYYWSKKVEGTFYEIEQFQRDKLLLEETNDFNKALTICGIKSNLDSTKGSYKEFAEQIKEDIGQSNCLSVLKDIDFDFMQDHYFGEEEITPMKRDMIDLNRCDMRYLIKTVFECEPVKKYKREFIPDYELIHCILHDDEHPSASVYKHVYLCEGCKPPVKLDQYNLIKQAFGVETTSEIVDILNEKAFYKKLLERELNEKNYSLYKYQFILSDV